MRTLNKAKDWTTMVLGAWLALSPAVLQFDNGVVFTVVAGVAIAVLSAAALRAADPRALTWTVTAGAAFLFFVPWIFGVTGAAAVNMRIVTAVMAVFSGITLPAAEGQPA